MFYKRDDAEPGIGAHDSGPGIRLSWVPASAVRAVSDEPQIGDVKAGLDAAEVDTPWAMSVMRVTRYVPETIAPIDKVHPVRIRSFAAVTALAVASAPLLAAPAQSADTTVGEAFATSATCNTSSSDVGVTYMQIGPSSYSAPTAGVITSWTAQTTSTFSAALRVGRRGASNSIQIFGKADVAQVSPGQAALPVRIPVDAGDLIGLYYPRQDSAFPCSRESDRSYSIAYGAGDAYQAFFIANFQLNVSATLEPDTDGDGFGDTTQDNCSTDATTQGACPDTTAPQTTITKVKAAKIRAKASNKAKAQVTVAFKADERSTFRCSIDGGRYKACSSPLKVKLAKGKHTVAVQATDTAGNVDKAPATAKVTVKRTRR